MLTNLYCNVIKFITYMYLIALLAINSTHINKSLSIILVLSSLLLSQFKIYIIKIKKLQKTKYPIFLLLTLLQFVILAYLSKSLGLYVYFAMTLPILQLALNTNKCTSILFGLLSIIIFYKYNMPTLDVIILFVFCISLVTLLSFYITTLEKKKSTAQYYYDKLRKTEDNLIKANKELKLYSSTIEELTLLRERTRVSRELHDSIGHSLSALNIQLKAIKTILHSDTNLAEEMISNNIDYLQDALESVRKTVRNLKPTEFEAYEGIFSIEKMIKEYSDLTGIKIRLILSKDKWTMNSDQTHHLYRIIQECIHNAQKHGNAKNITVSIQFFKEKLYVNISDDGVGCSNISPSFGLVSILERVKKLGGTTQFNSSVGEGFSISLSLPKEFSHIIIQKGGLSDD